MTKIHELSAELTNQIAAGEVIERPASVVKELCENSIDAGSTRIRISFVNAGLKKITVQDNGSGIASEEIDLAFTRHATSKISKERDLFNISTLGFRGEALASIAAVAHVEILTNSNNKDAVRATFAGGQKLSQEKAAGPKGTTITVEDLFYNTPARLKYLRSERTEIIKIVDIVNRLALGHPDIAFTLTNGNKTLLKTMGRNDLRLDMANIYGRRVAEKMLEIKASSPDFEISGLISDSNDTRSSRNFITLLLNGRYVKNYQLTQSILNGYGSELSARRYPIAVVNIKLDPLLVDVNVHPTKQEVRLSKDKELERLITQTISDVLLKNKKSASFENLLPSEQENPYDQLKFNLNKNVVNTARPVALSEEDSQVSEVNEEKTNFVNLDKTRNDDRYVITATWKKNVEEQTKLAPFDIEEKDSELISKGEEIINQKIPNLTLVGQLSTYILARQDDDLYIVDQLAARRRLSFDEIYQHLLEEKSPQQVLLEPAILDFSNTDYLDLKNHLGDINRLGIFLEDFGQNSFILRTYPVWLGDDLEKNVREILDLFLHSAKFDLDKLKIKVAQNLAPKKNPTRKKLSDLEAQDLLNKLARTSDPYKDSEGHIIIVTLNHNDLNKLFKKNE